MNRRWMSIAAVLLFLAGCTVGPPDAQVAAPHHDFGTMAQQSEAEYVFSVKNAGGGLLQLREAKDTCPCTRTEILTSDVPAGGVGQVRTVFASSWFHGDLDKSIYLTTNDPDLPQLELTVAASIVVDLGVKPRVHHLGDVVPGEEVAVSTLLTNHTDGPVSITGIVLPGPDVTVTNLPAGPITPERPLVLGTGQSLALNLVALPGPGQGTYSRKVVVETKGTRPGAFPVLLLGRYEAE